MFRTKKAAEQHLRALQVAQDRGTWIEPAAGKATLAVYASDWLTSRRPSLAPRTFEVYAGALQRHIVPALGHYQLSKITPKVVRGWWNALTDPDRQIETVDGRFVDAPLASATAAKAYRLLKQILDAAVREKAIGENPCQIRGAAVERSRERDVVPIDKVFELAAAVPDRYRALVLLAAFTGLRLGELRALRRCDVDVDAGTVRVTESISELQSGKLLRKSVKTEAGRRTVTIPEAVRFDVDVHLAQFVDADPDASVITSPTGGQFRASNFSRSWNEARIRCGLQDLRFHDLRHTANTLAAVSGASRRELMSRGGWASTRAAARYEHLVRDDQAIAETMSKLIAAARPTPEEPPQATEP